MSDEEDGDRLEAVEVLLREEAEARAQLHSGQASQRLMGNGTELAGLKGEAAFARAYDQPLDLNRKLRGDGGIDFVVWLRFTVDVKCTRSLPYLMEEEGKVTADIYVLAVHDEATNTTELVGWEWGNVLAKTEVRAFKDPRLVHHIHRDKLKPMSWIAGRIVSIK